MKSFRASLLIAIASCAAVASAGNRYVPPPGPPINDGKPAEIERETSGNSSIIHIKRNTPAREFQLVGDYLASLDCAGKSPLSADLRTVTTPHGSSNEELIFLTIPKEMEDQCTLSIINRDTWPWTRIFNAKVSSIAVMKD